VAVEDSFLPPKRPWVTVSGWRGFSEKFRLDWAFLAGARSLGPNDEADDTFRNGHLVVHLPARQYPGLYSIPIIYYGK